MAPAWPEMMDRALALAEQAAATGETPIGAVLALGDRIIAAAHNRVATDHDPTAHAEMLVMRAGAEIIGNERLTGAVLVTTLEPCSMCAGAAVLARIQTLVYGAADPKSGAAGSVFNLVDGSRLNHRIEVVGGLKADRSAELLRGFFRARRKNAESIERTDP